MHETGKITYKAKISLLVGDRKTSEFITSAGLGINGVGTNKIITIEYKPGQEVTKERVCNAIESMIKASNAQKTDFIIHNYTILEITTK